MAKRKSKDLTVEQLLEWAKFHDSLYPGFWSWMAEKFAVQAEWRAGFAVYTPEELRDASRIHFRRPNGSKETANSRQFADLLEILRGKRAVKTESYQVEAARFAHVCGLCRNTGRLTAVPRIETGFRFRTISGANLPRCAVACKCEAGDRFRLNHWSYNELEMMSLAEAEPVELVGNRNRDRIHAVRVQGQYAWASAQENFLKGVNGAGLLKSVQPGQGFGREMEVRAAIEAVDWESSPPKEEVPF